MLDACYPSIVLIRPPCSKIMIHVDDPQLALCAISFSYCSFFESVVFLFRVTVFLNAYESAEHSESVIQICYVSESYFYRCE